MALHVGYCLLGDAPELPFHHEREPSGAAVTERDLKIGPLCDPLEELVEGLRHVVLVGDVGAEVVQGLPYLGDDGAHIGAQLLELGVHQLRRATAW